VAEQKIPQALGKYEIKSILGRGAMGIVYRAYDPAIERIVAIKVMHQHLFQGHEGSDFAQRFQQEARAAARCWHPNIVAVFDFGTERDVPYLVMELVEGSELRDLLELRQLTMREAIELVVPVLSALNHAHSKGVVHRDIKPANIMVLKDGSVKVADFGVARLDTSDLTRSGYVVGTLGYMSPEGERGDVVDSRSDIYSTAIVLLQLTTGQRPYPGFLRGESVPGLFAAAGLLGGQIPTLVTILETALDPDPDHRFQSAEQFQNSLTQWLSGATVSGNQRAKAVADAGSLKAGQQRTVKGSVSPALLKLMEERLASYVGPMAGHFVRRACRADADLVAITTELAGHIPNQDERAQFLRAIESSDIVSAVLKQTRSDIRERKSGSGLEAPARGAEKLVLSADKASRIAAELTYFVGPLASRLVHSASARVSTLADLYQDLATNIPSEQDRKQFLERVNTRVGPA
jgi:serine/threonine-protein kinase